MSTTGAVPNLSVPSKPDVDDCEATIVAKHALGRRGTIHTIAKGSKHGIPLGAGGYIKSARGDVVCTFVVSNLSTDGMTAELTTYVPPDHFQGIHTAVVRPSKMPEAPPPEKDLRARFVSVETNGFATWITIPLGQKGGWQWEGVMGHIVETGKTFQVITATDVLLCFMLDPTDVDELHGSSRDVVLNPS